MCIVQNYIAYVLYSTELYITTQKNAFHRAEILKTFEIQQCIGFFVIAGLLEPFVAYVRPVNIRPAMRLIRLWH